MKRGLLLLCCTLALITVYAQNGTVTGTISGEDGETLPSANVTVKGTTDGATANMDGKYTLDLAPGNYTLEYTYAGLETIEKVVNVEAGQTQTINIILKEFTEELGITVISASKYEKNLNEVTVSMEIITPDKIQNTGNNLQESLNRISGFTMIGETPSIRGGSGFSSTASSRVLVLLDGLPVTGPENGGVRWQSIPLENIQQMEIIKGASSALYGSSAMNGVLNIITAPAGDEPVTRIIANFGGYQKPGNKEYAAGWKSNNHMPLTSRIQFFDMRKLNEKLSISSGASFNHDESFLLFNERSTLRGNTKVRYVTDNGFSYGFATNISREWGHDFFVWQGSQAGDFRLVDSLLYYPSEITPFVQRTFNFDPFMNLYDKKDNSHGIKLRYFNTFYDNQGQEFSNSHQVYGEYLFTKRNFYNKKKEKSREIGLNAGMTTYYSTILSKTFGDHNANNVGLFAQVDKKLWWSSRLEDFRLNLSFGGRLEFFRADSLTSEIDINPGSGETKSPIVPVGRFGMNLKLAQATYLRGSFGQGYRFPNVAELFIDVRRSGVLTKGNPDLFPEKALSAEIGIKQEFRTGKGDKAWYGYIDLAGFYTRYNDLIEPQFFGSFVQFVNVDNAKISGMELTVFSFGELFGVPLSIQAGYTFLNPINLDFDPDNINAVFGPFTKYLKYRNKHNLKLDLEVAWKKKDNEDLGLFFGVTTVLLSGTEEIDRFFALQEPSIGEYFDNNNTAEYFIDTRVRWAMNEHSQISFIARNITNREYMLRLGKLDAPRNFRVQYAYTF